MTNRYEDIIHLPHPEPSTHKRMPLKARAAQFAPFAALTGYGEAITEENHLTDSFIRDFITENILNKKIEWLQSHLQDKPQICVKHFVKDKRKNGGSYQHTSGHLRFINEADGELVFVEGYVIPFNLIVSIHGDVFPPELDD